MPVAAIVAKFDLNLKPRQDVCLEVLATTTGEDFSGTYMTEGALLILQRTKGARWSDR